MGFFLLRPYPFLDFGVKRGRKQVFLNKGLMMDKKEINPILKKELEHLQDIPDRGLQAQHAGRENFMMQVRSLKPRPIKIQKPVQKGRRRSWALRMASIVAVLALALGSLKIFSWVWKMTRKTSWTLLLNLRTGGLMKLKPR